MSKNSHEEMIRQINEAQMELKVKLEQVSRLRIDCAKLQLDILKLYKPQCLQILETLENVSEQGNPFNRNGYAGEHNSAEEIFIPRFIMRYTEPDPMVERSYAQQLNDTSANNGEQRSQAIESTSTATQTMELLESPPIFYKNTTVITMQPEEGESRFPRRPIPINTLDWISTPRPQLNAISGTQFLDGVEQLEIQQVIDLSTLLGRTERGTQYRVKVPRAETLFLAMESKSETQSRLYGWYKGFVLNVLDQCGETAFVIRKDPSWMHVPCSRQKITVESASFIGTVEENFSLLGPSFTVYNATNEPLCNIRGPNVCGCCMYKEAQFQVISLDGSRQIASLMHQWDHLAVDYVLLLTFPIDTDVRLKSLLLGASFLIEYLYFQRIRRASRR